MAKRKLLVCISVFVCRAPNAYDQGRDDNFDIVQTNSLRTATASTASSGTSVEPSSCERSALSHSERIARLSEAQLPATTVAEFAARHAGSVVLLIGDSNDRNALEWFCGALEDSASTLVAERESLAVIDGKPLVLNGSDFFPIDHPLYNASWSEGPRGGAQVCRVPKHNFTLASFFFFGLSIDDGTGGLEEWLGAKGLSHLPRRINSAMSSDAALTHLRASEAAKIRLEDIHNHRIPVLFEDRMSYIFPALARRYGLVPRGRGSTYIVLNSLLWDVVPRAQGLSPGKPGVTELTRYLEEDGAWVARAKIAAQRTREVFQEFPGASFMWRTHNSCGYNSTDYGAVGVSYAAFEVARTTLARAFARNELPGFQLIDWFDFSRQVDDPCPGSVHMESYRTFFEAIDEGMPCLERAA